MITLKVIVRMTDGSIQKFEDTLTGADTWEDVWKNLMIDEQVATVLVRIK